MTSHTDPALLNTVLQLLSSADSESFAEGLRLLVNEAMVQERAAALQARPYERTPNRLGFANGFKSKTLNTHLGPIEFDSPQVRGDLDFYPSALEKGLRSEKALMAAMAEMYVQGVSTRKVSAIVEELCGHAVSSSQVSKCTAQLDAELHAWRQRPRRPCRRTRRRLPIHPLAKRCQFHLQQNAQTFVPRLDIRASVAEHIRSIFNCPDLPSAQARFKTLAESYSKTAPKLAVWMEENLPQGFTILSLPPSHQRRLRTSNALERLNQEIKRRTRVASLFPNEASLLRLVSAILCEIDEDWISSKVYLNMNPAQTAKV